MLLFLLFLLLIGCRIFLILRRIQRMDCVQKTKVLNDLLEPFGFHYFPEIDIISSTLNAWQRDFGYTSLFDYSAVHFNMVFDCEPIYFDYQGRTWLLEFWKGQYGINTGCEVGLYYADSILEPSERFKASFHSVTDQDLLPMKLKLFRNDSTLFSFHQTHWWLTGFRMGIFSQPEALTLCVTLTFPDSEMLLSFIGGLTELGYHLCNLSLSGLTISVPFKNPLTAQSRHVQLFSAAFAQWKNRLFCKLFRLVTWPLTNTADRLLYLYFLLPFAFRHSIFFRRSKKQKFSRKCFHRKE